MNPSDTMDSIRRLANEVVLLNKELLNNLIERNALKDKLAVANTENSKLKNLLDSRIN